MANLAWRPDDYSHFMDVDARMVDSESGRTGHVERFSPAIGAYFIVWDEPSPDWPNTWVHPDRVKRR